MEQITKQPETKTQTRKLYNYLTKEHTEISEKLETTPELDFSGMKRQAGKYQPRRNRIVISTNLIQKHPEKVENTVKHELAHAITHQKYGNVQAHGREWKSVMRQIGETPNRCHRLKLADYNYIIECEDCNHERGLYKKSKTVRNIDRYRCGKCGGKLHVHTNRGGQ